MAKITAAMAVYESTNQPRLQFEWTVEFVTADAGGTASSDQNWKKVTSTARSIEPPRINLETVQVNEYNIRRNRLTHVTYEPITITLVDTYNNYIPDFLKAYTDFYVKNFSNAGAVSSESYDLDGSFGVTSEKETDQFIEKIVITKTPVRLRNNPIDEGSATIEPLQTITLYNPKIIDFSQNTLDYSASGAIEYTLTVRYEAVDITGEDGGGSFDSPFFNDGPPNTSDASPEDVDRIIRSNANTTQRGAVPFEPYTQRASWDPVTGKGGVKKIAPNNASKGWGLIDKFKKKLPGGFI